MLGLTKQGKSLRDSLLMELFALMQLGLLVEYGCCEILKELKLLIWPVLNKKFTLRLRYVFQMLFGFFLLCMLVLGVLKDIFYGITL